MMRAEYKHREIEHYRMSSQHYDDLSDSANLRGFEKISKAIQHFMVGLRDPKVLDLGCGTGRYFDAMQNCEEIVGIDLSEEMLHVASRRVKERNINLVRADIFALPLRPGAHFGMIVSIGVLGVHVPLTNKLLADIRSLLKDKGQIFFTTNRMASHWRQVLRRKFCEFLRRKPNSRFFVLVRWSFPVQPYAEISYLLKRRLKRAGYVPQKVERTRFAADGYLVTARVIGNLH